MDRAAWAGLLVATVGGAAIGLERQWSGHASGPHARFGGIRTFTMLGALAGLAGHLALIGWQPLAVVLLAAAATLVVIGYAAASRTDVDGTTEVAALVVLTAGTLAGLRLFIPASAMIAGTAVLLLEKTRLHALIGRVDDASLRASARFAAMACVVLPLLPVGPYGPYDAFRPRELWALVLFFSGLSFLGWMTRRFVGAQASIVLSGVLGGVVSSTATTLRCARESRVQDAPGLALAGAAIGACTVMLLRVTLACAVLNPALALTFPRFVWPGFLLGLVAVAAIASDRRDPADAPPRSGSPLQLRAALEMTALFQVVLVAILAAQSRWGAQALAATAAFIGLTDLDALTLSLARSAATEADVPAAAVALAAGILSNTTLKLLTALVVGRGRFRVVTALVLGGMAVTTGLLLAMS